MLIGSILNKIQLHNTEERATTTIQNSLVLSEAKIKVLFGVMTLNVGRFA